MPARRYGFTIRPNVMGPLGKRVGFQNIKAPAAPRPVSAMPTPGSTTPPGSTPGAGAGASQGASQADPRDAQYFNDVAKLQSQFVMRRADLQAAGEGSLRDYNRGIANMAEQQPKDILKSKEGASNAGLFYSGALGKNLGEIETGYAKRRSQLAENYQAGEASRLRQLHELDANQALGGNDALLAGVQRGIDRDSQFGVPGPAVAGPGLAPGAPAPSSASFGSVAARYAANRRRNPVGRWGR